MACPPCERVTAPCSGAMRLPTLVLLGQRSSMALSMLLRQNTRLIRLLRRIAAGMHCRVQPPPKGKNIFKKEEPHLSTPSEPQKAQRAGTTKHLVARTMGVVWWQWLGVWCISIRVVV